jgi:hypothetical protein
MDQIHLSPLVDQIQLTLGHISNRGAHPAGVRAVDGGSHTPCRACPSEAAEGEDDEGPHVGVRFALVRSRTIKAGLLLLGKANLVTQVTSVCS